MQTDKTVLNDPSKQKVNLFEYIAVSHSLLGLCFAKGKAPVHERLSFFAFVTSATMLVSMLFATYPLPFEGFLAHLWVIIVTVSVVTPSSFAYKCIGGCLPSMKCLLEVFTLFLVSGTVYYALTEPRALGAAQISALALMAEWVAEAPSLVFKYFFCATVCPCCIPKKEAVNSMSDMVGGAPACHIDMDR